METAPYLEALAAFTGDEDLEVIPITNGLINKTYRVSNGNSGEKFLLQRINEKVFSAPGDIQSNYEKIWGWLQSTATAVKIPRPLIFLDQQNIFRDSHGAFWRVMEFIDRGITFSSVNNSNQARKVAVAFGKFTAAFADFDPSSLANIIPGFHDLSQRYLQFQRALYNAPMERIELGGSTINELKKREHYVIFFDGLKRSGSFRMRVMHHDAKITNILFDEVTGDPICPVDLDTCMPGYFFSDLGDLVRSMSCPENENSNRLDEITIQKEIYNAIIAGYLETMGDSLTSDETKHIHQSGLLITYMQALRFMTDFLAGDIYYTVDHPGQNLDRSKNQLLLLQQLEVLLNQ